MTAQVIGRMLLMLGGTVGGLFAAGELRARHRFLAAMERAAGYMRGEIGDLGTPLPVLLERLSGDAASGFFFRLVAEGETGMREVSWRTAAETAREKYRLCEADVQALRLLGEGLGQYGLEDQLRRLLAAERELAHRVAAAEENRQRYAKILRFGGFAAGAVAALLI